MTGNRQQAKEANHVRQKTRRQQQCGTHQDEDTIHHSMLGNRAGIQLLPKFPPNPQTLIPCKPCPYDAGKNEEKNGRHCANPSSHFDDQCQFNNGNKRESQEKV